MSVSVCVWGTCLKAKGQNWFEYNGHECVCMCACGRDIAQERRPTLEVCLNLSPSMACPATLTWSPPISPSKLSKLVRHGVCVCVCKQVYVYRACSALVLMNVTREGNIHRGSYSRLTTCANNSYCLAWPRSREAHKFAGNLSCQTWPRSTTVSSSVTICFDHDPLDWAWNAKTTLMTDLRKFRLGSPLSSNSQCLSIGLLNLSLSLSPLNSPVTSSSSLAYIRVSVCVCVRVCDYKTVFFLSFSQFHYIPGRHLSGSLCVCCKLVAQTISPYSRQHNISEVSSRSHCLSLCLTLTLFSFSSFSHVLFLLKIWRN